MMYLKAADPIRKNFQVPKTIARATKKGWIFKERKGYFKEGGLFYLYKCMNLDKILHFEFKKLFP